ncbi:MAG TPA: ATP-dependent DNA ligase [Microthrixaceae bacterium]|nr:ATP-dependent DNA ligase [Microthrixaceae bacterium]
MLFAELVATSDAVASTRARTAKVAALAELLGSLEADEIVPAVAALSGAPRQGKVGVGWASAAIDGRASDASLTIGDFDRFLDELAVTTGPGSQGRRRALLDGLGARATPAEADFVRRLFLGELRQGALAGIVADAVSKASGVAAPKVRRAAMLTGDLALTAELALVGGADAIESVGLEVGTAVQPMLASTATDVAEAIAATGDSSVEWKLDGARVQAHRRGDEVRLFTRNLNDVTERLPALVEDLRRLDVESIILDGEALGVGDDGLPVAFQDSMSDFGRSSVGRSSGVAPRTLSALWFDVLHLDGVDLIDEPLAARRRVMESIAGLDRIPSIETSDPDAAQRVLDESLATGHEGVMVKALGSTYAAGRRGAEWRKVKPVHTLDLVVLAVEWGSGRRRGWLSNLHLGALGPDGTPVMVGKTFKGMTDAILEWQTARFLELETHRDGHVVFVRPEQVVEIALDGAQASTRYPGGVALRFARVRRYRDDKSASEADTLEAVGALLPRARR